jgi:hypothetical protein
MMAGFGLSIGDIVLVSNFAYSVYKSSRQAGDDFKDITADGTYHLNPITVF